MFQSITRRALLGRAAAGMAGLSTAASCALRSSAAASRQQPEAARGIALTIGLNAVDPSHYGGWDGQLLACEFDAEDIAEIAQGAGFEVTTLKTNQATAQAVQDAIAQAADSLEDGDIFLLHYSGHGGQLPDRNDDETDDAQDETWCLYDRQFVDDELYQALGAFQPGVRVLVLSDSCHSGTVTKAAQLKREYASVILAGGTTEAEIGTRGMTAALAASGRDPGGFAPDAANPDAGPPPSIFRIMPAALDGPGPRVDNLPALIYRNNRTIYDPILEARGAGDHQEPRASVLLISGCQDNQLSLDGQFNGMFTGRLKQVWNRGDFQGDYRDFHRAILTRMPSTQSPNFFWVGAYSRDFERQKPFTVVPR